VLLLWFCGHRVQGRFGGEWSLENRVHARVGPRGALARATLHLPHRSSSFAAMWVLKTEGPLASMTQYVLYAGEEAGREREGG
jgi:hypothetical protein